MNGCRLTPGPKTLLTRDLFDVAARLQVMPRDLKGDFAIAAKFHVPNLMAFKRLGTQDLDVYFCVLPWSVTGACFPPTHWFSTSIAILRRN